MIYLDYSANTPAAPEVLERFCNVERNFIGNANSLHTAGRNTKDELAAVTESIAELIGVSPAEIIYTSGASEANNLAVKGIARASRHIGKHIISTPLEHSSVSAALTYLQELGWEIDLVRIGTDGKADTEHLKRLLRKDTVLVAVCAVDSELGTVQPVREIADILAKFPDCRLHVDATQAVGKTELVTDGVSTMSIAPHKFYGLNGSGLLIKRRHVAIEPLIHGGSSTTIYRSGTPTLALDSSSETALRLALCHQEERVQTVKKYNAFLRERLSVYPKVMINSPEDAVPHILNLSVHGVKGTVFQRKLDENGVCVSVKSACSSDGLPSRAVMAVCHDRRRALSSWRISLSHLTTYDELNEFLYIFKLCYEELTQ